MSTNTITREEISRRLGISQNAVRKLVSRGTLPPILKHDDDNNIYHDREICEAYMLRRLQHKRINPQIEAQEKEENEDVYGTRRKKEPFVYSGIAKNIILMRNPTLLNRHTFDVSKTA